MPLPPAAARAGAGSDPLHDQDTRPAGCLPAQEGGGGVSKIVSGSAGLLARGSGVAVLRLSG